ncbi:hypothetical protein AAG747_00870 [Rapidithrix thailandica]|uniref:Uncharacterized protein n=1 Tax=Rapidithrix thailandica TaxID=413964 RepID=A0AAW9RS86_9BACT
MQVSFINLLLVVAMGCLLRWMQFNGVPGANYQYLLHTHSHLAFLGWVFNALFTGIVYAFLQKSNLQSVKYRRLFIALQIAVVGMMFTFPFTGYALWSIVFSTVHLLLTVVFTVLVFKDSAHLKYPENSLEAYALKFVKSALVLMLFSGLGPLALGPLSAKGMGGSQWYYLAIYFYLHFQYNGWFLFAVFGLFFKALADRNIPLSIHWVKRFYQLNLLAIVPAFLLSTLWTRPSIPVYLLAGLAALLQVVALYPLFRLLKVYSKQISAKLQPLAKQLWLLAFAAFVLKTILQLLSAFPPIAQLAFSMRDFVIAYLHLVLIGVVSLALIAWFVDQKWLQAQRFSARFGIVLFVLGYLGIEVILVLVPTLRLLGWATVFTYYPLLFSVSLIGFVGVLLLAGTLLVHRKKEQVIIET